MFIYWIDVGRSISIINCGRAWMWWSRISFSKGSLGIGASMLMLMYVRFWYGAEIIHDFIQHYCKHERLEKLRGRKFNCFSLWLLNHRLTGWVVILIATYHRKKYKIISYMQIAGCCPGNSYFFAAKLWTKCFTTIKFVTYILFVHARIVLLTDFRERVCVELIRIAGLHGSIRPQWSNVSRDEK